MLDPRHLLLAAIFGWGMFVSTSLASPAAEPLEGELPAAQTRQNTSDSASTLPVLSLVVLLVGGVAVGVHTRRQDEKRVKLMQLDQNEPNGQNDPACGKNPDTLEGVPFIG